MRTTLNIESTQRRSGKRFTVLLNFIGHIAFATKPQRILYIVSNHQQQKILMNTFTAILKKLKFTKIKFDKKLGLIRVGDHTIEFSTTVTTDNPAIFVETKRPGRIQISHNHSF